MPAGAPGVVIVGAGQAGFQAAFSLRAEGYDGAITLVGDEPYLPYQRPPLSKAFMAGKQDIDATSLRPEAWYGQQRVEVIVGETVAEIDRQGGRLRLRSGGQVPYAHLILAVGARNRLLPVKGADLDGVCYLRTRVEALNVQERLDRAENVVIIGGGFIGLELAAIAAAAGKNVQIVEAQPRLMARVVAPVISSFYREVHEERGVLLALGAGVSEIVGERGVVRRVVFADGSAERRTAPADLVLVGIGVVPETELAASCGLAIGNGIRVDARLRTDDENIFAIGDCAEHPNQFAGGRVRIESVQNAVDQARCVAAGIAGQPSDYRAVPWFWTDQFDIKLQMAGLSAGADTVVTRGTPESRKFSVFYFKAGTLLAIDSINRPGDHLAARKLLDSRVPLTPEQATDPDVDLKALRP